MSTGGLFLNGWVHNQDMLEPSTWTVPDLCSLRDLHATLIRDYHCVEGPLTSQQNDLAQPNGQLVDNLLSLPLLNSLARMQDSSEDGAGDSIPKLPSQKRLKPWS